MALARAPNCRASQGRSQSSHGSRIRYIYIVVTLDTASKGRATSVSSGRFVVQKHQATHLHYDFRLELDGVLKSWAVPKEPPTQPGIRRLAVHVEDHDLDYIDFEGAIPEGEYGAGTVEVWDEGTYMLRNRTDKIIEFTLNGSKLTGNYALINFKENNWLLFKKKT